MSRPIRHWPVRVWTNQKNFCIMIIRISEIFPAYDVHMKLDTEKKWNRKHAHNIN